MEKTTKRRSEDYNLLEKRLEGFLPDGFVDGFRQNARRPKVRILCIANKARLHWRRRTYPPTLSPSSGASPCLKRESGSRLKSDVESDSKWLQFPQKSSVLQSRAVNTVYLFRSNAKNI